jgi:hypothetical protein
MPLSSVLHHTFDAHMILVQVAERKILYSGNFRRTGRKSVFVNHELHESHEYFLLLKGGTGGDQAGCLIGKRLVENQR